MESGPARGGSPDRGPDLDSWEREPPDRLGPVRSVEVFRVQPPVVVALVGAAAAAVALVAWWCYRALDLWSAALAAQVAMAILGAVAAVTSVGVVLVQLTRASVTLTEEALVVERVRGALVIPWADILTVSVVGPRLSVSTMTGWHVLPLCAAHCSWPGGPAPGLGDEPSSDRPPVSLVHAVRDAWLRHRPEPWAFPPVQPWVAPADGRGMPVLRSRLFRRWTTTGELLVAGGLLWPLRTVARFGLSVTNPAAASVVGGFVLAVLMLGYLGLQTLRTVTVTPTEVIVGGPLLPRHRIDRRHIDGVVLVERPGGWMQLALRTRQGEVRLPAPISGSRAGDHDPDFYRRWAWLERELSA